MSKKLEDFKEHLKTISDKELVDFVSISHVKEYNQAAIDETLRRLSVTDHAGFQKQSVRKATNFFQQSIKAAEDALRQQEHFLASLDERGIPYDDLGFEVVIHVTPDKAEELEGIVKLYKK